MENEKEIILDIGAGYAGNLIRRARQNPGQKFLVVGPEPRNFPKEALPANLSWITGKAGERNALPFRENAIDEVNLDFVLVSVHGEQEEDKFPQVAEGILKEAFRVLRPDGKVFLREPAFMMKIIKPILAKIGHRVSERPVLFEEALNHSEAAKEFTQEYLAGDRLQEVMVMEIPKTKGKEYRFDLPGQTGLET